MQATMPPVSGMERPTQPPIPRGSVACRNSCSNSRTNRPTWRVPGSQATQSASAFLPFQAIEFRPESHNRASYLNWWCAELPETFVSVSTDAGNTVQLSCRTNLTLPVDWWRLDTLTSPSRFVQSSVALLSLIPDSVSDLEGGRAGFHPLGDGLTPSLTVLLICDNGTILWRHHRHFFSSST